MHTEFSLNALDYTLIAIVLASSIIGLTRGFVRESLSFIVILVALWVSFTYSTRAETYLVDLIPNAQARLWAAVIGLILVALLLGSILKSILMHFMKKAESTYLDKFMGCLFGILRGLALVGLIVWGISNTNLKEKTWWKESGMVSYMQSCFAWLDQYRGTYTSVAEKADPKDQDTVS